MMLRPVVTSYCQPCQGQVTIAPSSSPSPSGPPRWIQVLSIAWKTPPTLNSAISLPFTVTHRPVPGATSPAAATFTKLAMGALSGTGPPEGSSRQRGRHRRRRGEPVEPVDDGRYAVEEPRLGVAPHPAELRERRDVGQRRRAPE